MAKWILPVALIVAALIVFCGFALLAMPRYPQVVQGPNPAPVPSVNLYTNPPGACGPNHDESCG